MKPRTIYLASQSYRRRSLLKPYLRLQCLAVDIDESEKTNEKPQNYIRRVTKAKWQAAQFRLQTKKQAPLITADTIVVHNNEILQKPQSKREAKQMLESLSGQTHFVLSAVAVGINQEARPRELFITKTKIVFRKLQAGEVRSYLQSGEWRGKAGAYGIQGRASRFVDRIDGSLTSVVGLPLEETLQAISRL